MDFLKRLTPLWLAFGFGGLVVAGVVALLRGQFDSYAQGSLAAALVGFALALILNRDAAQIWLGGRQARYGSNSLVMTAAFVAIVVMINFIVYQNPKRWDLSEDQANTLAPETLEALKQLPEPVKAVGFYSTNFADQQRSAQELLDRYKIEAAGKFTYEFHDTFAEPALTRQYNVTTDGSLVLVMGDQREEVNFASEQQLTGALTRLSHPGKRTLYFLTGHGEKDITDTSGQGLSQAVELLKNQNYEVKPLNLQVTVTVPSDARAIVIAGPLKPVTADEVTVIGNYLHYNPGSALIVLLDPAVQTQSNPTDPEPLVDYLAGAWGVSLRQDLIIDPASSLPNRPTFVINASYGNSDITRKVQRIASVFINARSIVISDTAQALPGLANTPLAQTSDQAWGETDIKGLEQGVSPTPGEGDARGPLTLGVAVDNSELKARLVVFGDSDFAGNVAPSQSADALLFLNSVNWATVEESLINLTSKTPTARSLKLVDNTTTIAIGLFTVGGMPVLVLVLGAVVWFQRRRHG